MAGLNRFNGGVEYVHKNCGLWRFIKGPLQNRLADTFLKLLKIGQGRAKWLHCNLHQTIWCTLYQLPSESWLHFFSASTRSDASWRQWRSITSIAPGYCLGAPWNVPIEMYSILIQVPFYQGEHALVPLPFQKQSIRPALMCTDCLINGGTAVHRITKCVKWTVYETENMCVLCRVHSPQDIILQAGKHVVYHFK